jgi:hypothetical protein
MIEILVLVIKIECLNKLKAKIGIEIEKRLENIEIKNLIETIKYIEAIEKEQTNNNKKFPQVIEIKKWILFHISKSNPTENEIEDFGFNSKTLISLMCSNEDKHISQLFHDTFSIDKVIFLFLFYLFLFY